MRAVLSEKGEITIPKALREKLGLLPGAVLEFHAVQSRLIVQKKVHEDVFKKWRGHGHLPRAMTVAAYLKRSRDTDRS